MIVQDHIHLAHPCRARSLVISELIKFMLTLFSSNFSLNLNAYGLSQTQVLVGPSSTAYYGFYCQHDALTNASVHVTSAALSTSATTCRNLNVYRVKCSGIYSVKFQSDKQRNLPYTGSLLLCVMKYSEGQTTIYNSQIVGLKTLLPYSDPGNVVFHRHYFDKSKDPRNSVVDFSFDFGTNITIKPNQRLRIWAFCFAGNQNYVPRLSMNFTTTVFYNGN